MELTIKEIRFVIDALKLRLEVWDSQEQNGEILEEDMLELPNDRYLVEILIAEFEAEKKRLLAK